MIDIFEKLGKNNLVFEKKIFQEETNLLASTAGVR